MSDFLRNMDPMVRTSLAIFLAVVLKSLLASWWERFKAREALKPVNMKLRDGVHVPWGTVDKIRKAFNVAVWIWIIWMAAWLCLLAWHKFVFPVI